ncbi:MAG: hypothetical protein OXI52_10355 [Caldilineaceae bacterium]|nr:hypothetical protein [Caldilineaceae bacterium]
MTSLVAGDQLEVAGFGGTDESGGAGYGRPFVAGCLQGSGVVAAVEMLEVAIGEFLLVVEESARAPALGVLVKVQAPG